MPAPRPGRIAPTPIALIRGLPSIRQTGSNRAFPASLHRIARHGTTPGIGRARCIKIRAHAANSAERNCPTSTWADGGRTCARDRVHNLTTCFARRRRYSGVQSNPPPRPTAARVFGGRTASKKRPGRNVHLSASITQPLFDLRRRGVVVNILRAPANNGFGGPMIPASYSTFSAERKPVPRYRYSTAPMFPACTNPYRPYAAAFPCPD